MTTQLIDLDLLVPCHRATAEVLDAIPADRWDAPTPCPEWTVREVANHVVGSLDFFAQTVSGQEPEIGDLAADYLGADPAAAYREAAKRCRVAFARPGVLDAEHPFPTGPTPGWVIAHISMSESLVHGWDLATGAGLPYTPDPAVVAAVDAHAEGAERPGMFDAPVPVAADAPRFVALLGKLGRVA
jgi:uncharacterized protein (TIGR03086 family)